PRPLVPWQHDRRHARLPPQRRLLQRVTCRRRSTEGAVLTLLPLGEGAEPCEADEGYPTDDSPSTSSLHTFAAGLLRLVIRFSTGSRVASASRSERNRCRHARLSVFRSDQSSRRGRLRFGFSGSGCTGS